MPQSTWKEVILISKASAERCLLSSPPFCSGRAGRVQEAFTAEIAATVRTETLDLRDGNRVTHPTQP